MTASGADQIFIGDTLMVGNGLMVKGDSSICPSEMKLQKVMSEDTATFYTSEDVVFNGNIFVEGQTDVDGSFSRIQSYRGRVQTK